jgi:hypothetical protein
MPAAKEEVKKAPRQKTFEVMEDAMIKEIEDAAQDYAEVRDNRMKLTLKEAELKEELHAAMKKHKKAKYFRAGIEVEVVSVEETVKVRIAKKEDKKAKKPEKE